MGPGRHAVVASDEGPSMSCYRPVITLANERTAVIEDQHADTPDRTHGLFFFTLGLVNAPLAALAAT